MRMHALSPLLCVASNLLPEELLVMSLRAKVQELHTFISANLRFFSRCIEVFVCFFSLQHPSGAVSSFSL